MTSLLDQARQGSRVALARALSMVENQSDGREALAPFIYKSDPPYSVGLTGAPGAGKSTLTCQLIKAALAEWSEVSGSDPKIAILAVDPSSPFSGGAILGDRVRMQEFSTDPRVYIRSMATRGHLGGLALAVPQAIRVLGAVGFSVALIETVGVGQMEVEVASQADTTIVVVTPGWGDSMQANKAGLLEVADLFVINKADRPDSRAARRDLDQMLDLSALEGWRPPIIDTVATTGEGVEDLFSAIAAHKAYIEKSATLELRRKRRAASEIKRVMEALLADEINHVFKSGDFEKAVLAVKEGSSDPYRAAQGLMVLGRKGGLESR